MLSKKLAPHNVPRKLIACAARNVIPKTISLARPRNMQQNVHFTVGFGFEVQDTRRFKVFDRLVAA